jgi:hypothetical protein
LSGKAGRLVFDNASGSSLPEARTSGRQTGNIA